MIDPMLSLAFSMNSNKGVYAVLLGSGISRTSGIPTGWEIVMDLVRKLAALKNELPKCDADPAKWYWETFSEEPSYSGLLEQLAHTPNERNLLLKPYFEPNDDERDEGKKLPTAAHKAIAELMLSGHVRLVLTTNFDRLMEQALEEKGISPTVISTPESAEGALPLIHTDHCIIKLHGDYLDPRIKNTPDELSSYEPQMGALLDRVLDEFGLLICGWSAEWDSALCEAIEMCKTRRFSTYWSVVGEPTDTAKKLMKLRGASQVDISGADHFFVDLSEKVKSLQEMDRPHPLSAQVAVATLKRYLPDERHRIRLHDLVMDEAKRVYNAVFDRTAFPLDIEMSKEALKWRIDCFDAQTEILCSMLMTGIYFGEPRHVRLWADCIRMVASIPPGHGMHQTSWDRLQHYPAAVIVYAGGLAALAGEQYACLRSLLFVNIGQGDSRHPVMRKSNASYVGRYAIGENWPGRENRLFPISEHLGELLRSRSKIFVADSESYDTVFDRFEYLLTLIFADWHNLEYDEYCGLFGRFCWRFNESRIENFARDEAAKGEDSLLLQSGLFGGSVERLNGSIDGMHDYIMRAGRL